MIDLFRQLRITGRVQGVGYRYSMQTEAERLNVRGWVRNRRDGSVEAFLYGLEPDCIALIDWARKGPVGARVDTVEVSEAKPPAIPSNGFSSRPTE